MIATKSYTTISFPIAFQASVFSIVTTAYGLTNDASNVYVYAGVHSWQLDEFSFYAASNATGRMWVALGC